MKIFIIFSLLICSLSYAKKAPYVLYHWSSSDGLERWANEIETENEFLLKKMTNSGFTSAYPNFEGARGVFAWSHPTTGMGAISNGVNEWYAKTKKYSNAPPRLTVIHLKDRAEVVELNTVVDYSQPGLPVLVSTDPRGKNLSPGDGTGLILHKIIDSKTKKVMLQEYIILKRGYIESISSDPVEFENLLLNEIEFLRTDRRFSEIELHSLIDHARSGMNTRRVRDIMIRKIQHTLEASSNEIPDFFRSKAKVCTPLFM